MKRKMMYVIAALGLLGTTVFAGRAAHALGNPSFTWTVSPVGSQQVDYVTDNLPPFAARVGYIMQTASTGMLLYVPTGATNLQAGHVYYDGLGLQCTHSGNHFTGWTGPYPSSSNPNSAVFLFCNTSDSGDTTVVGTNHSWGAGLYQ
jgi:hypothetical protein